jgi:glucosylceramidase
VDASGWGTANGTWVQQWACGNGQANQEWQLVPVGGGYDEVLNRNASANNEVLDVAGGPGATGNGTQIQLWAYVGGSNQQWQPVALGNGYYELVARNSGKCLDVTGGSSGDGVRLQQWSCYGGPNQTFRLTQQP